MKGVKKVLKVGVGGELLAYLTAAAEREQVAESELVRRALWLYFGAAGQAPQPAAALAEPGLAVADPGPDRARSGPGAGPRPAAGGGSPPFSPLHSPHPPSVSPPLPPEEQSGASPAGPGGESAERRSPPSPLRMQSGADRPGGESARRSPGAAAAPAPLFVPPADPGPEAAEAVLAFPCIRHPGTGATEWALARRQLESWTALFPAMDVLGELRKAREYLVLRPERRKTFRGMPRFLFAWLARGQDSGRYLRRAGPAADPAVPAGEGSLFDEYGFASWEQWEATLRATLSGETLDRALARLGELRRREGGRRA